MIRDLMAYIKGSLLKRLTRSSLTIFSIVLGIMAIYALLSFGQGLQKYVDDVAADVGTNKILVQPKGFGPPGSTSKNFERDDAEFLARQNGVQLVASSYMSQIEVKEDLDKKGKWVYVMAIPLEKEEMELMFFSFDLERGRLFKDSDKYKAILGYNYQLPLKIFEKPLKLGDKVYINGQQFEIIGFMESIGNPNDDSNVYIPETASLAAFGVEDEYNFIYIETDVQANATELAERLTERLRKEKGQKEGQEDFFITSFAQQLEIFTNVITILNAILVLIAAVSVLVAAVNIANTMYTAVIERTKEIGVMKAIGSRNSYIMGIFVIESGVLGLVGGLFGIFLGWIVAKTAGGIAAGAGYEFLQPFFPWWLTLGCVLFATAVGTLSGFLPARQAAKLRPVDALRYE
jgi:putative ABC transport system permease protein